MFELLFKYPVALFQKGQFVLLSPWPPWTLAVIALAAAVFLLFNMRRNHGMLSGARPLVIWLLECALVALLAFLLLHPALSVATLRPQQNVVAVLVDGSRSMGIRDASPTRLDAARATLASGLLEQLQRRFQVRLYKFGREAERIQQPAQAAAVAPASHLAASLKQVLAESSQLPLGAIVLLSDGADNSGGIDRETIQQIRQQRIPIHTIGYGKEHAARDVELEDVVLPERSLPEARLTADVTLRAYGLSAQAAHLSIKDGTKVLAARDITLPADGVATTESLAFNAGAAATRTLTIAIDPIAGEENAANNQLSRVLYVEARKPRILYLEGEPRWEYKFIRRALDDEHSIELVSLLRTTQNKIYRQGIGDSHELEAGFPTRAEELFAYQGLIIGSVEASYFTPAQQDLIREFVNRRGGGLLFLGGRYSLSDGGYNSSPLADLLPVTLTAQKNTFHRDFTPQELTAAGRQNTITRLDEKPERNAERWKKMPLMANYQDVGEAKPGAVVLLDVAGQQRRHSPLLAIENYGRGRTAVFATAGSWRWKMWQDHTDKSHATFWQQMFRYLAATTPGPVTVSTPRTVLADEGHVPLRVEVRDATYKPAANATVDARVIAPDGSAAQVPLTPVPLEEGVYAGEYSAAAPGTYVVEAAAARDKEPLGRNTLTFLRQDGVAENFHTGQNRELLEKLSEQTGGRYYTAATASRLSGEISYSEAGITSRETRDLWDMPIVFLLALMIRSTEWLLRRRWGVV